MKSMNDQGSTKPHGKLIDSNDEHIIDNNGDKSMMISDGTKKDAMTSGEEGTYDQISEGSCGPNSSLGNNTNINDDDDDDDDDDGMQILVEKDIKSIGVDRIGEGNQEVHPSLAKNPNINDGTNKINELIRANVLPTTTKAHNSGNSRSFTEILLRKSSSDDDEDEDYNDVYGELNDWISLEANASHIVDPFNLFQWS